MSSTFRYLDPGYLVDNELRLSLAYTLPGDALKGYVPSYRFTMVVDGHTQDAGNIELRVGNTDFVILYVGHIGYRVHTEFRGHHLAARSCRLILPFARRHNLHTLWITCNPDNLASRRTCEIIGAQFVEIVDLPHDNDLYREGDRQKCRYRLDI